jgi:hypothetical protein
MIDLKRTRIILDGKVVNNVTEFVLNLYPTELIQSGRIFTNHDMYNPIFVRVLDVDIVKENEHNTKVPTVTYTQIVCETMENK